MTVKVPRITEPRATAGQAPSHSPPDVRYVPGNALARFLGYFSLGLGLAEMVAPRAMARLTGVRQQGLLQAYGAREFAAGMGILGCSRPTGWMWARVAGDALDVASLAVNMAGADNSRRQRVLASLAAVAGVTILDLVCAAQLQTAGSLTDD